MSLTNLDSMPPESHSITAEPTSSNGQGVANTTGATGFNQCPLEICRDILDYLSYDLAILKNCSLTCRTWYLIHADTARWVTVFLQGALFVMESLTLKFGPLGRHNDIPNEIAAAFASLDASHDTRVRCLTLRFYDQREDGFHAGDGILDTRSPLLSNFSSSILEKIELSYELALYYAEFVVNEIAPIEEHLIRLVRERREPGCRLEVVVKLKQHICFVNSDLVSVSEEQYEQRKNTVDKFGDALKRLRACRPGGRLQLENHSSDQVIALIMRVRFE